MKKNIFVVMYNFMPIGIGRGIAWNNFGEHLAKNGYNVEIITVEPSKNDPYYNKDKLNMISKEIKVTRLKDAAFYYKLYKNKNNSGNVSNNKNSNENKIKRIAISIYKKMSRLVFYPDRMKFWSKSARKYLESKKLSKNDIVVSVGFPFSTHLEMYKLKKKTNCKLIFDYGDPWSFNPSVETEPTWRKKIDQRKEIKILKEVDMVSVTTDTTKQLFKSKLNCENVKVVRQGVNLSPYKNNINSKESNENITMVYTGIFYKEIRDPSFFFDEILKLDETLNHKINIKLAGHIDDYFQNIIEDKKLLNLKNINLSLLGNIGFNDCIELQKQSDFLLFFSNKEGIQVPGKLYEYLATDKPILCISYSKGETEEIIEKYKRGVVLYNGDTNMHKLILELLESKINKSELKGISNKRIYDYDWNNISAQILDIINEVSK